MKSQLQQEKDARRSVKKLAAKAVRLERQKEINAQKEEALVRLDKWVRGMRMHIDMTQDLKVLEHTATMWENEVYPDMRIIQKHFNETEQGLLIDGMIACSTLRIKIKEMKGQ